VLLIIPDATWTCPLGMLFKGIFEQIGAATTALDVMIALGTHQPMSEEAICIGWKFPSRSAMQNTEQYGFSITSGISPQPSLEVYRHHFGRRD
jgi:hypothetical protein